MNYAKPLGQIGSFFRERQRWALLGLLLTLHLTLMAGGSSAIGVMCWIVDVGFFILWQPFIQTEKKLNFGNVLFMALALALGAWLFNWWLLIVWASVLAALLGGRVIWVSHRPSRIFYLLAFAYLIAAILVWLVPKIVPESAFVGPSLEIVFAWLAPVLFLGMLLLPLPQQEIELSTRGVVDFFYSLFIFLLIAVLVLGSLAFMQLQQRLYFEALIRTVAWVAMLLLLIAWAWNPRPGFSGIGVFFSRYLLTVGMPFDAWLQQLMDCSERETQPEQFMKAAGERLLLDLPWVLGVHWRPAYGSATGAGRVGEASTFRQEFVNRPLCLTIYTRHALSPVLVWHLHLLAQLASEFYLAKWRAKELEQMSYLRAIHETGARLTHDMKNLMQSLDNLCFLMESAEGREEQQRLYPLLWRQLPQIAQRLQQTLVKLQSPRRVEEEVSNREEMSLPHWWSLLQQRFSQHGVTFESVVFNDLARIPCVLFDSVADNLLHNALTKRQNEQGIGVKVSVCADGRSLRVCDSGKPVRRELLDNLLQAPVDSESGFGIGLYHAARQAAAFGYSLTLASNIPGHVCFTMQKNDG